MRWSVWAASALLGACTGSLFQSKQVPPAVYLLSGTGASTGAPDAQVPADLAILRPRVRSGLDSDRIAVLFPDRRLDFIAGARWSGPLDEVVQDLTVQAFHSRRRLRNVSADASAFSSAYWLEVVVVDFQAEYSSSSAAPTVHVHFLASLGGSLDRRILGRYEATAYQLATENRVTDIVGAYERAANAALGELVADSAHTLSENSLGREAGDLGEAVAPIGGARPVDIR